MHFAVAKHYTTVIVKITNLLNCYNNTHFRPMHNKHSHGKRITHMASTQTHTHSMGLLRAAEFNIIYVNTPLTLYNC